ncbi:type II secretion system F family protein [Candidatus Nitrososphaera sp. FF02]|uniref:type II secretion system F family protein n=1 Tax=Candidatus Nitrososphaera sp. FF02 TaxID=3398226 RepID=UPI0039EC7248
MAIKSTNPLPAPKRQEKKIQKKSQPRKKKGAPLSLQERFAALAIRYFGGMAGPLEKRIPTIGETLLMSNMFIAPQAFLSMVLFITFLSVPLAVFGALMFAVAQNALFLSLAVVPAGTLAIGLYMPSSSKNGRASAVDGELAFVIGYLSVLITGGVSPIELFRRLSRSAIFPASAREAKRIIMNVDILALDPVTAIEKAARHTPNKMLSDFLSGYIAVLKIGGDIKSYMEQKQKEVYNHRSIKLKATTEFVGTLAEAYLAATVVMGTSLFILQIVQAMVSRAEFSYGMMYFYAGIFMPAITGAFIFILHSLQTKEPLKSIKQHVVFLAGLAFVPLMAFVVPLQEPMYLKLGIGLVAASAPAAIVHIMDARRRQAAERMLPSFILDLAEVRKTGLAPEKCIEQLSTRNYGELTPYVRRMASQVSWGVPLNKVLKDFGKELKSWFVVSIGFILLEVVEIGGGTTTLFSSLADFTQRTRELEKERKTLFRPYIFLPYIGAVLTIASTVLIVSMMTTQLAGIASGGTGIVQVQTDTRTLSDVMLTAAVFQGWLMGMVGGKMAEWSIGSGYKHASILVVVCLLTVYLINMVAGG